MIRKDLIIAILATFCLTITLFLIIPTAGQYDPWLDFNDDGKIDGRDLIMASKAFATYGDPTKNVNVTNPRAKVVEEDLNISVSYDGETGSSGGADTVAFDTEGYDRMFVAAAIVDISNTPFSTWTWLQLLGARWHWGTISGKDMTTYEPVDYNRQVNVTVSNPTELPKLSDQSSEFPIEASRCSLFFYVYLAIPNGSWVSIHVYAYLTE